jgi:endo-1,4-beta-D-glucanase Y
MSGIPNQLFSSKTSFWIMPKQLFVLLLISLFFQQNPASGKTLPPPGRPFPQHTPYVAGSIKPTNISSSALDDSVRAFYDRWKAHYLVPACTPGQYYIWGGTEIANGLDVSEGMGYGCLITAFMAGYDPNAQTYFDGLYNYYRAHPSENNHDLMAWKQLTGCVSSADSNSATDGDLDIAYGLLLADKQWGSGGTINYFQSALRIIAAIRQDEINPVTNAVKLGDWAIPTDVMYHDTRTSDFLMNHFRAFGLATGDAVWDSVLNRCYSLVGLMQSSFSPATGLIPDFIRHVNASPIPATPNFLESPYDGHYYYNACRDPFRIGIDYLLTGDPRAYVALQKINSFIRTKTGDDPEKIRAGYRLNGTTIDTFDISMAFTAPFAVGAMIDSSNQQWLNNLWTTIDTTNFESNDYYGNTLKMLCLIALSGNWWNPETERALSFSGYQWNVRSSTSKSGPGPNYFSDSSGSVWVDGQDRLHMKISHVGAQWRCSEVTLAPELGYGRYVFRIDSPVGALDPNEVLGLFTWDDAAAQNHREIDIECSRWGNAADTTNAQFVVQPYAHAGNLTRWTISPDSLDSLTMSFDWQESGINFLGVRGRESYPPYSNPPLASWSYGGADNPSPGNEHAHMNFWLMNGLAPNDGKEAEIIISRFEFNPVPPPPAIPILLAPGNDSTVPSRPVTLRWHSSLRATAYRVQIAVDSLFNSPVSDDSTLTDTTFSAGNLTNTVRYFWRVRALNSGGASSWSSVRNFVYFNATRWELISLRFRPADPRVAVVYPEAIPPAFSFEQNFGYVTHDSLSPGAGYWLRVNGNHSGGFTGDSLLADSLDIFQGWNLIGSISVPVPVAAIHSIPGGMITSNFFGYDGGYTVTDTLLPGSGYWIKSANAGKLILLQSGMTNALGASARIVIVPTNEMPPPPPGDKPAVHHRHPERFTLEPNYPNPFNPSTVIRYQLPGVERSVTSLYHVSLKVYNLLGQCVTTLVDDVETAGNRSARWDASGYPSGIYFYRLEATDITNPAAGFTGIRKMAFVK